MLFILIEALDGEDVADRISAFSLFFALFKSKLFLEVALMSLLRGAGVLALEVLTRFAYALPCLVVVDDL